MAEAAHGVPDLADDVQDRAARQRVEGELERRAGDVVADKGAEEGRPAADEPGEPEPAPRRLHAAQRAYDPESLGRVVQGEADDQDGREADLARLRRHPDGEPLSEVVHA